jgi:hypothetical protein
MIDVKNIHIGNLIKLKWEEKEISIERTCNFFKLPEERINDMFLHASIDSEILLKWSKLLEYDLFRLYSGHLILYSPQTSIKYNIPKEKKISLVPEFRKNIYTKEIVDFILELITTDKKTRQQVIDEYKIPKTTLYKWLSKYKNK